MNVVHLNARSIGANGDAMHADMFLLNRIFDVICLSETWITKLVLLMIFYPNYTSFYSIRHDSSGVM